MPSLLSTRLPRVAIAVCGAAVLTLSVAACGSSSSGSGGSSDTGSLTLGLTGGVPVNFNPHSGAAGNFQAMFPAYDTLLHVDDKGDLQPWLATAYEYTDPTTLQLTLRDGVTFTDGTPFDAAAVKTNLEFARDTDQGTGFQGYLKNITDVQAVDDSTVRIVLAEPNPGLAFDLSQLPGEMVSPKALASPDSLASAPAGTGPYVIDTAATRQGTTVAYERNADYWATDENLFPYDTVTYTFAQDPTAIRNGAQAGSIDTYIVQPGDSVVSGFDTVDSTSGNNAGFTGFWIDTTGTNNPALRDVRVRQAMNYAIDRKTIADTIYAGAIPVSAVPVDDSSTAYSDQLADQYPYDPDKARQLLSEAGVSGLSLKMLSLPQVDNYAQAMAANLRDVGIDVTINSVAGPDLPQQLFSGSYDVGLLLQRPTGQPGQDLSALFTTEAFFNVHKGDDPQIDAGLATAASTTDPDAQAKAYQDVTAYASQQAWFAGTLIVQNTTAVKTGRLTVTPPPYGEVFLYDYQPS